MSDEIEIKRDDLIKEPEVRNITLSTDPYHFFTGYLSSPVGILDYGDNFLYQGAVFKVAGGSLYVASPEDYVTLQCRQIELTVTKSA